MLIGSLFSGIGGLELGLERAGLGPVAWQCEIDPFCRAVLAKHWPNVTRFDDVTRPRDYPHVDLICGGFPCQDVSSAGRRRGIGGARSGLWWYFASIVEQVRPRFVVVENVASGAKAWLPHVRHQLHMLGYRTRAYGISAADVGAPHLRRRVFVVADAHRQGESTRAIDAEVGSASAVAADAERAELRKQPGGGCGASRGGASLPRIDGEARPSADVAGLASGGAPRQEGSQGASPDPHGQHGGAGVLGTPSWTERAGRSEPHGTPHADAHSSGREGPWLGSHEGWARSADGVWEPPLGGLVPVVHGLSGGLVGRGRRERIRALGNSVVPQCAEAIGRLIASSVRTEAA